MSIQKTVLITGASGFIGRYVARLFHHNSWNVVGIDSSVPENAPLANLNRYYSVRLPSPELAKTITEIKPDVCIHCAGRASVALSVGDPLADYVGNSVLTFELLNAIRLGAPQCRLVLLSSAAVYGDPVSLPINEEQPLRPLSPYGFHKLQSEQICVEFNKVYGIPTAIARIFSVYAPGLRRQVMWDICRKALFEDVVSLQGTGNETRDFIHAKDVAQALMIIATKASLTGEVYNLGSGESISISSLALVILQALERPLEVMFDGVSPPGNPLYWRSNIAKLESLGYEPNVIFATGVQVFARWCKAELTGL